MPEEIVEEVVVDEEPFVANGITFDGKHSYSDFGLWLAERPNTGVPKPKLNSVEVPGMDGALDMTEANTGEVKYSNREMVFEFSAMIDVGEQEQFKAVIRNALHGKYVNIIVLDEDPTWHYSGRATVDFPEVMPWKLRCVVTVDAAPYAQKNAATVVNLLNLPDSVTKQIDLEGEDLLVPGNTDLRWGTQAFPDGNFYWTTGMSQLTLTWPTQPSTPRSVAFYIFDGDGDYFTTSLTIPSAAAGSTNISLSNVVSAGVDLTKIYRVFVTHMEGVRVCRTVAGYPFSVQNSRKAVVPRFEADQQSVYVIINGEEYEINDTDVVYDDIILKPGLNDVFVPGQLGIPPSPEPQPGDLSVFKMSFVEGKL